MPAAFEARWLQPLLSPESMTAPREQVVEFDLGKFLVIETNDVYLPAGYVSFLLDGETIVAATEEKKAYLEAFLKAAYPNLYGGPTLFPGDAGVGAPDFTTLESYVNNLKEGQDAATQKWARENADKPYPFPLKDYGQLRAELLKKLEGRDALILRYVNAKKDAGR